jgi:hypothetical protein
MILVCDLEPVEIHPCPVCGCPWGVSPPQNIVVVVVGFSDRFKVAAGSNDAAGFNIEAGFDSWAVSSTVPSHTLATANIVVQVPCNVKVAVSQLFVDKGFDIQPLRLTFPSSNSTHIVRRSLNHLGYHITDKSWCTGSVLLLSSTKNLSLSLICSDDDSNRGPLLLQRRNSWSIWRRNVVISWYSYCTFVGADVGAFVGAGICLDQQPCLLWFVRYWRNNNHVHTSYKHLSQLFPSNQMESGCLHVKANCLSWFSNHVWKVLAHSIPSKSVKNDIRRGPTIADNRSRTTTQTVSENLTQGGEGINKSLFQLERSLRLLLLILSYTVKNVLS